jgi:hypothetical protein
LIEKEEEEKANDALWYRCLFSVFLDIQSVVAASPSIPSQFILRSRSRRHHLLFDGRQQFSLLLIFAPLSLSLLGIDLSLWVCCLTAADVVM